MVTKFIPHNQVPQDLFLEIVRDIGNYSVALARVTDDRTDSFQILGSGTCVRRGDVLGILTAHHVLHAHRPPVRLGSSGPDRIFFFAKDGRTPGARQHELFEQPLGEPEGDGEFGPDLSFIPLPLDSSLRGTCSFWDLNLPVDEVLRTFAIERACMVNVGYPANRYDTTITDNAIHASVTLVGGAGAHMAGDVVERSGWDYINSECDYTAFPHLPASYQGISGGGIWSALLHEQAGKLVAKRIGLVGVNFWQTEIASGKRMIRGHFVRSIYERAWLRP